MRHARVYGSLGAVRESGDRFLYSASNPIGEECFRECGFVINEAMIDEVAVEAELWIDFWRDSYAFIASRVAAGLRRVLEKTPGQNGAASVASFLRACQNANLSLPARVWSLPRTSHFRKSKQLSANG